MRQVESLYRTQKGVCPWCGFTMVLEWQSADIDALATVDHLVTKRVGQKRPAVAAHRLCNNSRGHQFFIRPEVLESIQRSASQFGLTKDRTTANLIWERKIKRHYRR